MKKALKILVLTIIIFVTLLIAIPYMFQDQMKQMVKNYLNNNLDAEVNFEDVNLSLLRSFPKANLSIDGLTITNHKPFEAYQLAAVKSIEFDMSIKELLKKPSDGPIVVNTIEVNEALVNIKSDKFGNNNYDILKQKENQPAGKKDSKSFTFSIDQYAITNSALTYLDEDSSVFLSISELNHSGKGTFSADKSELDTHSQANISLSVDSTNYLYNNSIKLDALIDLNLSENLYSFKKNKGYINQLPIQFNGYVKLLEDVKEIDISFQNTGSDFKDFLAVIPKEYSKDLDKVSTTGTFKVDGSIKGMLTDTSIPKLNINIASKNASFKYPDLPKSIENISINAKIKNETGNADDTYVAVDQLDFKIEQDVFKSSATLKNITKNILVDANLDGTLNLANISKSYPFDLKNDLNGIIKGKLHTEFDFNAIENNAFDRIKSNGTLNVSDFVFSSDDVVNPINISKANIDFKPGTITLKSMAVTSGNSDFKAAGTINNLLGFLLSDKNLKGDFNVTSNNFKVSDFMVESGSDSTEGKQSEKLKIPSFLDCVINANARTVLYDNLILKDVKGTLVIKDEKAYLKNMSSNIFDGGLTLNGTVDTKPVTPTFSMKLGVDKVNISQSFNDLELFQNLAPIAKALKGKLNSTIELSGDLTNDYTPNLSTVSGHALVELLTSKIEPKNEALFNQLKGALNFVDFDQLDLKDVKTNLSFENGNVNVKPFNLKYKDVNITVDGSHNFDKSMSYQAVFDVPAKYLGTEVNNMIAKIDDENLKTLNIPVTAKISGSLTQPTVTTDLTNSVANLTKQLIEIQKNKLIKQGKDQIKDLLSGVLGGDKNKSTQNDSTNTNNQSKDPVKGVLDQVIGNNKKDSTKNSSSNSVKDVFGGILGGKKKKQDSVN